MGAACRVQGAAKGRGQARWLQIMERVSDWALGVPACC